MPMLVKQMISKKLLLLTALAFLLPFVGCKKNKQLPPPAAPVMPAATPTPVSDENKEKPVYVYGGDRYRDPFQSAGGSSSYTTESIFDPNRSAVKAIIFSPRMKSAIINVSGSGTYFVKDGRIFDVMGKTVKGFSAKVLVDRVIVMGEADNVFELKINKEKEEEAKTL